MLAPQAVEAVFQHLLDTYVSETEKIAAIWRQFTNADLVYRPDPKSSSVAGILTHQLLSERRFYGEFLGAPEPPATAVLPEIQTIETCTKRLIQLAARRLPFLAAQTQDWWLTTVPFFDVERERVWIFWRRVLHSAHHRTQLSGYLRMLGRPVISTYGPTADVTWTGADPTNTVEAASRS